MPRKDLSLRGGGINQFKSKDQNCYTPLAILFISPTSTVVILPSEFASVLLHYYNIMPFLTIATSTLLTPRLISYVAFSHISKAEFT